MHNSTADSDDIELNDNNIGFPINRKKKDYAQIDNSDTMQMTIEIGENGN